MDNMSTQMNTFAKEVQQVREGHNQEAQPPQLVEGALREPQAPRQVAGGGPLDRLREQKAGAQAYLDNLRPRRVVEREEPKDNIKYTTPKFNGSGILEDYLDWKSKSNMYFDYHPYVETKKVQIAILEFVENALNWWNQLVQSRRRDREIPIETWANLKSAIRKRFVPSYYINSLYQRLQALRQGSMRVDEYYFEMLLLMSRAEVEEAPQATMARFLSGLNREIHDIVEMQQHYDLEEMLQHALKAKGQVRRNSAAKKGFTSSSSSWKTPSREDEKMPFKEKEDLRLSIACLIDHLRSTKKKKAWCTSYIAELRRASEGRGDLVDRTSQGKSPEGAQAKDCRKRPRDRTKRTRDDQRIERAPCHGEGCERNVATGTTPPERAADSGDPAPRQVQVDASRTYHGLEEHNGAIGDHVLDKLGDVLEIQEDATDDPGLNTSLAEQGVEDWPPSHGATDHDRPTHGTPHETSHKPSGHNRPSYGPTHAPSGHNRPFDPLAIPQGSMTRARAKRFKEALLGFPLVTSRNIVPPSSVADGATIGLKTSRNNRSSSLYTNLRSVLEVQALKPSKSSLAETSKTSRSRRFHCWIDPLFRYVLPLVKNHLLTHRISPHSTTTKSPKTNLLLNSRGIEANRTGNWAGSGSGTSGSGNFGFGYFRVRVFSGSGISGSGFGSGLGSGSGGFGLSRVRVFSGSALEANPDKVMAILNMCPPPPPQKVKQIQELTGRVAALNRFISKPAERCLPFFKILRTISRFVWTPECRQAFDQHLSTPPLLSRPEEGETLYMYLVASNETVAAVLIRETDQRQLPVYYEAQAIFSFTQGCSSDRPTFERGLTKGGYDLETPEVERRVVGIRNRIPAPKGNQGANPSRSRSGMYFLRRRTDGILEGRRERRTRETIDRQPTKRGAPLVGNAGPENQPTPPSATYDQHLEAVMGKFEVKEPSLVAYYWRVQHLWTKFPEARIQHIPREENSRADALSKLACSDITAVRWQVFMEYVRKPKQTDRLTLYLGDKEENPDWMVEIEKKGILRLSLAKEGQQDKRTRRICKWENHRSNEEELGETKGKWVEALPGIYKESEPPTTRGQGFLPSWPLSPNEAAMRFKAPRRKLEYPSSDHDMEHFDHPKRSKAKQFQDARWGRIDIVA
ncbi:Retrotransposon gag protein [Corchorus capsularis]|uniref:Retrotransposon gag protein n=1 Tax=Corchorus capsularis TaxID=210143 RepID=A0A1R3JXG4_COCAP|nr:Retrotransposon gag protein [Corchorus capsularis]